MPIFSRLDTTTASASVQGVTFRLIMTRLEHSLASQTPSWFVSYLDCFISSLALASSPRLPSEGYGLYSLAGSLPPSTIGGRVWGGISPNVLPPQACRKA